MSFLFRRHTDKIGKTETVTLDDAEPLISYQLAAVQGIGRRAEQQDSYAYANENDVVKCKREGLFAVVADGMGGLADGKRVSELIVDCMLRAFADFNPGEELSGQLEAATIQANKRAFQEYHAQGGSTLIACLLLHEKLWYVSVGDSALYLLRNGSLSQINTEQNSLMEDYRNSVKRGSMDPTRARNNPEKAALSHFMGMYELDEVDFFRKPLPLEDGDSLLICSDGVSGFLSEEQIKRCMQSGSPRDVCSGIEEYVYRRAAGNQDNYTAIVIQCKR